MAKAEGYSRHTLSWLLASQDTGQAATAALKGKAHSLWLLPANITAVSPFLLSALFLNPHQTDSDECSLPVGG